MEDHARPDPAPPGIDLVEELQSLSRGEAALFSTACATRVGPIFAVFGGRTAGDRFRQWAAELWALVDTPDLDAARGLAAQIRGAPEAVTDDSNRPEFYAMRALSALDYAVRVLVDPDHLKPAIWCSRASIALMRDLDYDRGITPGSPDSMEAVERDAQKLWIERLHSGSDLPPDAPQTLDLVGVVSRGSLEVVDGTVEAERYAAIEDLYGAEASEMILSDPT